MTFHLCDNCNLPSPELLRDLPSVKPGEALSNVVVQKICETCNDCLVDGDADTFVSRHENRPRTMGLP